MTTTVGADTGLSEATGAQPTPVGGGAESAVRDYYRLLNRGRFGEAWDLLGSAMQSQFEGFDNWRSGYRFTEGTVLDTVDSGSGSNETVRVDVTFNSDDVDACGDHVPQRFAGSWTVQLSEGVPLLVEADIAKVGGGEPVRERAECPQPFKPPPAPPDYGYDFDPSEGSYPAPGDFCSTHECIPNFDYGNGYIVQCADGTYSHSGGIQGACSWHGGVR